MLSSMILFMTGLTVSSSGRTLFTPHPSSSSFPVDSLRVCLLVLCSVLLFPTGRDSSVCVCGGSRSLCVFAGFSNPPITRRCGGRWQRCSPLPSSPPPSSALSLSLGPCLRQARENVVLFLEGTATCRSKGGMEPEWAVISAITCAHVTGLARGPCGVNHRRPGIIAAFPFQLQKA